jgi:ABC-type antimicrobial peptide transport system permease subunit
MRTHRLREAIIFAIVAALLVMGLCNGAAIVAYLLPFHPLADMQYQPFTLKSELNLLWYIGFMGAVAAVFGFFSTLNRSR